ncbi:MAG: polysaccharide pyruvyl transferase family protein [Clostridia bacterium]|nr:polysaccharide pyruvyl transferase family protein [Clostridia bacterium]
MKKVGLLTIHAAYNYGAALQTYATQKTVCDAGAECTVIDFSTSGSLAGRKFFRLPLSMGAIKHDIRNILKPRAFFRRKKGFDAFRKSRMKLTSRSYTHKNFKDIEKENFDLLITGSDQTLNLNLGGEAEERKCFYLPDIGGEKITYSASMGEHIDRLTDEQLAFIGDALSRYKSLSVREERCADLIEKLCGNRPAVLADPTLAVEREHWESISEDFEGLPEKYIFFYTVLSEAWVIDYVKSLSQKTGLPVVAAHPQNHFEVGAPFIRVDTASPEQFIRIMKKAQFTVATSFHGTAFAINLNCPFISIILGAGNRITPMLEKAGLSDRGFRETPPDDIELYSVDFKAANEYLEKARKENLEFLREALKTE